MELAFENFYLAQHNGALVVESTELHRGLLCQFNVLLDAAHKLDVVAPLERARLHHALLCRELLHGQQLLVLHGKLQHLSAVHVKQFLLFRGLCLHLRYVKYGLYNVYMYA